MDQPMENKKGIGPMFLPTVIMGVLALVFFAIAYYRGQGEHITGLKFAFSTTLSIFPLLIFAFIMAGMVQTLLPQEVVSRWVGAESGMRGILVGTLAGGLTPGGPFVSFPLAAGLMKSGAGAGTLVAFLTSWSLLSVARLPMEFGILGWKLTLIRITSTFFFPPIAGLIAHALFGKVE